MVMTLQEFTAWSQKQIPFSKERDERFERVFKLCDRDKDGSISFRELLLMTEMQSMPVEKRLRWVFSLYDVDGDGILS